MIAWQVGNFAAARDFARDAQSLLQEDPRIARVVLVTAMAGLALADGDATDSVRLATSANTLGTDLGVERELPLARCILARGLLETGDASGASVAVESAFAAAAAMSLDAPFAICLETAALVGRAVGADEAAIATVLASAAAVREHGNRPAPADLEPAVTALRLGAPSAEPLPAREAAVVAHDMLSGRVRA
jgi:ATP/maltotriose-dependent transcriptional regulator MalT